MKKYGIIISVENYKNLSKAKFSDADADLINLLFKEKLNIDEKDILLAKDKLTNDYNINDLEYFFKNIDPECILYFYYAGHGFFADGINYLTTLTADNRSIDFLKNTSISIDRMLFERIQKYGIKNSIGFFDMCSEAINEYNRGAIFNNRLDILEKNNIKFNYGIYFSCTPEESAKSNDALGHGVWTKQLYDAFYSDIRKSINCEGNLTTRTLKDYLEKSFKNKKLSNQTPYTIIAENHEFIIYSPDEIERFEDLCKYWEVEILNICSIADSTLCIGYYDYDKPMTYAIAREICWDLYLKKILDYDWENTFNALQHYNNMVDNNQKIMLTYDDEEQIILSFKLLYDDINNCIGDYIDKLYS